MNEKLTPHEVQALVADSFPEYVATEPFVCADGVKVAPDVYTLSEPPPNWTMMWDYAQQSCQLGGVVVLLSNLPTGKFGAPDAVSVGTAFRAPSANQPDAVCFYVPRRLLVPLRLGPSCPRNPLAPRRRLILNPGANR